MRLSGATLPNFGYLWICTRRSTALKFIKLGGISLRGDRINKAIFQIVDKSAGFGDVKCWGRRADGDAAFRIFPIGCEAIYFLQK